MRWVTGYLCAAIVAGVSPSIPALAQPQIEKLAAKDGATRGREALEKAKAAYAKLKTYQESCTFKYVFEAEGDFEAPEMSGTSKLVYAQGGKLRITSEKPRFDYISDGSTVWIVEHARKRYVEAKTDGRTPQELVQELAPTAGQIAPPSAQVLARAGKPVQHLLLMITKVIDATPEVRDGRNGVRVNAEGSDEEAGGFPLKISVWIDDETGLMGECVMDMTEGMKKQYDDYKEAMGDDEDAPEMPEVKSAKYVYTFSEVKVNEAVDPQAFAFTPPADYEKVEDLMPQPHGAGEQMALLGKPAPAIKGKLLDGSEFSLEAQKGKVVVLDFWATWCGPCVQAIPHVQAVADKFKDKPVVVLGVNQDQQNEALVKKFLAKKKLTLLQYMDDGSVQEQYKVSGIPTMVLIDAKGNVQDIKVGFGEGEEDTLTENIEKLLAGKDLRTPDEIANLQAGGDDPESDEETAINIGAMMKTEPNPIPEVAADKFSEAETKAITAMFHPSMARRVDVDGDGKQELVAAGFMGGLQVLSSDAKSLNAVKFKGVSRMTNISAFEPVTADGKRGWLLCLQKFSGSSSTPSIALYDDKHEQVWAYIPREPPQERDGAGLHGGG